MQRASRRSTRPARWLVTSDPAGRGAGYHLAVFAHAEPVADLPPLPTGLTPGTSPLPPYETIFGATAGDDADDAPAPDPAPAWAMRWEPITSMRG